MKKTMKYTVSIVAVIIIIVSLCSCGSIAGKDLSGEYTIDEFLELIKPANDELNKKLEYMTEEEQIEKYNSIYINALKNVGFNGGEEITLNGILSNAYFNGSSGFISITDKENTEHVIVNCDSSYGWVPLENTDKVIKVRFKVGKMSDDNNGGIFIDGEILSPSKTEYVSNCVVENGIKQTVYGTVVSNDEIDHTKDEIIKQKMDETAIGSDMYYYLNAMLYGTNELLIEDEDGNQVFVFVKVGNSDDIKIGDKIGCIGSVYSADTVPMLDASLIGNYYIFRE